MGMQFRPASYLPIKANSLKEAETLSGLHPENIILIEDQKSGKQSVRSFDFGRFCYTRKDLSKNQFNEQTGLKQFRIDSSSFRPERRNFIAKTIEFIREQRGAESSVIDIAGNLTHFFFFLEKSIDEDEWPSTMEKSLTCYQKYVDNISHRMRLPRTAKQALKGRSGYAFTNTARELVCSAHGLSKQDIERIIPSLVVSRSDPIEQDQIASKSDRQKFVHFCLSIFEQLHESILNQRPFPWRIDLSNAGIDKTFIWAGQPSSSPKRSIYTDLFYDESGAIFSEEKHEQILNSLGFTRSGDLIKINGSGNSNRSSVNSWFRKKRAYFHELNTNDDLYESCLRTSYELATYCFWYSFLAATSLNYSVASELRVGSEEYIPERGYVFSGLKVRARNKTVHAEFKKQFQRFFIKFQELRSWAVSQLDKEPPIWFFLFERSKETKIAAKGTAHLHKKSDFDRSSYRLIPNCMASTLKSIVRTWEIDVELFPPRMIRQGVSFDFYKLSGSDSGIVAQKLGSSISTVQQAYSRVNEEDSPPELADYYNRVITSVKAVGRSDSNHIPVRIIDDDSTDNLPVGNCDNSDFVKPKKAEQFTEGAPDPDCARSETCLFCEFFAIHADETGLRKLLSFRELFPLLKERAGSIDRYIAVFAPIEGRIEEILEHIKKSYLYKAALIEEISEEVSEGDLDEFWSHHFNFLIELGYAE
ncbi:hypothetical protein [Marinomonas fungiae]|uniref:hypothetical protein n=1 Tax=Marinomonas fungiae TaxID=1137284 RepID=UPI003A8D72B9